MSKWLRRRRDRRRAEQIAAQVRARLEPEFHAELDRIIEWGRVQCDALAAELVDIRRELEARNRD